MSDTVFLDPLGTAQMASELRREAAAVRGGGGVGVLTLPGDDAGVAGALVQLLTAEQGAAAALASHVDTLATRLDTTAGDTIRADRFGIR
jgi:hypothetical protein